MTRRDAIRSRIAAAVAGVVLVACGSSVPSAAPSQPPASTGPTPTPLTQPALPSDFSPSPTGCPPLLDATGPWPSDRLAAVEAVESGMEDVVRFRFGEPSSPGASTLVTVGIPTSELLPGEPDEPVDIDGGVSRIVRIQGLADPAGFSGERDLRPDLTTVRHVKLLEETADTMTWGIGAGYACLSLRTTPGDGTIAIAFSHAVP